MNLFVALFSKVWFSLFTLNAVNVKVNQQVNYNSSNIMTDMSLEIWSSEKHCSLNLLIVVIIRRIDLL